MLYASPALGLISTVHILQCCEHMMRASSEGCASFISNKYVDVVNATMCFPESCISPKISLNFNLNSPLAH